MSFKVTGNTWFEDSGDTEFNTLTTVYFTKVSPVQGQNYGYYAGGGAGTGSNVVEQYSYISDGNATDSGDLGSQRYFTAGQTDSTSGYVSAGSEVPSTTINRVEKFAYAGFTTVTDIGDVSVSRYATSGHSSREYGYTAGGTTSAGPPVTYSNVIDRFPFSAPFVTAADVGDLTGTDSNMTGHSSSFYAYACNDGGRNTNQIQKWPFASSTTNAVLNSVNLTGSVSDQTGFSGGDYGYTAGGTTFTPSFLDVIYKFAYAADETSTDIGNLTVAKYWGNGTTSVSYGYFAGGNAPSAPGYVNVIEKFPLSSAFTTATDVGDLSAVKGAGTEGDLSY